MIIGIAIVLTAILPPCVIDSINYYHLNFIHLIPIPEIGTI